eukprot:gene5097-biopygen16151
MPLPLSQVPRLRGTRPRMHTAASAQAAAAGHRVRPCAGGSRRATGSCPQPSPKRGGRTLSGRDPSTLAGGTRGAIPPPALKKSALQGPLDHLPE